MVTPARRVYTRWSPHSKARRGLGRSMARRVGLAGYDDVLDPQSNELQPFAWPLPCRRRLLGGTVNVGFQPELRVAVDWAFCHYAKIA